MTLDAVTGTRRLQQSVAQNSERVLRTVHEALAAACHRHQEAVLAEGRPRGMNDGPQPPIVIDCLVLRGRLAAFDTTRGVVMEVMELPGREGGWRSRAEIRNGAGQRMEAELMCSTGPPSRPPDVDPACADHGSAAHRAQALRSVGRADLHLAASRRGAPAVLRVPAGRLVDVSGAPDLLALWTLLDRAEALPLTGVRPEPAPRSRRLHGFRGSIPPRQCEVVSELWAGVDPCSCTRSIRSHLRCAASGEVLAVSETLYRP